jgi:hypothetical protein
MVRLERAFDVYVRFVSAILALADARSVSTLQLEQN